MCSVSLEPCWEINPNLWKEFCKLTRRDPTYTSPNWTELDVHNYLQAKREGHEQEKPGVRRLCPL